MTQNPTSTFAEMEKADYRYCLEFQKVKKKQSLHELTFFEVAASFILQDLFLKRSLNLPDSSLRWQASA